MRIFRNGSKLSRVFGSLCAAAAAFATCALAPTLTQTAIANGDTRTISLIHAHTNENITATFRVNGQYDGAVLEKLNWFLRDWRHDEPTKMDPRLFDLVWETYRESGSREPIKVMSAYRSPATNAMLRRRSRAVAEFSQHIQGKAMDQHYLDVPMSRIREIGLRLQRGGVGYYPSAGSPFVHLDVGSIRHWPRMSYDQLARIFPDGRTVHIPSNGQPLPGYEVARAQIEASGAGNVPISSIGKTPSFFAALFGGGDEDEGGATGVTGRGRKQIAARPGNIQVASVLPDNGSSNSNNFFLQEARRGVSPAADVAQANNARLSRRGSKSIVEPAIPAVQLAALAPAPLPKPAAIAPPPVEEAPRVATAPAEETRVSKNVDVPLPPRRPAVLVASLFGANVPLPPVRPAEIGALTASQPRPDPLAKLIVASNRDNGGVAALPDVILHGTNDSPAKPTPLPALSYAATGETLAAAPKLVIAQRPAVVASVVKISAVKPVQSAAKADRSGLQNMIVPEPLNQQRAQTALGAAAPPLRSAGSLRAQTAALFADPLPGTLARFELAAAILPTDQFLPQ